MVAEQTISQVFNGLLWTLVIGALLSFTMIFYLASRFKHKVVYKDHTLGGIWVQDKARPAKDNNGAECWKLQKTKKVIFPSNDLVYQTVKGKAFALFHRVDEDTFVPVKEDSNVKSFTEETTFSKNFNPMPTDQKASYIYQIQKNQRYKKKNLSELVAQAIPYIAMIMILTVFMIFFNDVVAPTKEMAEKIIATQNEETKADKDLALALNRFADILESQPKIAVSLPSEVPI